MAALAPAQGVPAVPSVPGGPGPGPARARARRLRRHRIPEEKSKSKEKSPPDPREEVRSPPASTSRLVKRPSGKDKSKTETKNDRDSRSRGSKASTKQVRIDLSSISIIAPSSFKSSSKPKFSTTSRSTSLMSKSKSSPTHITAPGPSNSSIESASEAPPQPIPLPHLEEQLFTFCKYPLHDFESVLNWLTSHPPQFLSLSLSSHSSSFSHSPSSSSSDPYAILREKILWQTYKTFERLLKRDFEERCFGLVREFAEGCVRTYAVLDFVVDCGWERGREWVRGLVLTPELARMNYLSQMMSLPPQERLEFINRPVPGQLQKLKFFCLLYDHLYEKIEQETRHRMEKTLLDRFATRLEGVQARLSRGLAGQTIGANGTMRSPARSRQEGGEVGRAV